MKVTIIFITSIHSPPLCCQSEVGQHVYFTGFRQILQQQTENAHNNLIIRLSRFFQFPLAIPGWLCYNKYAKGIYLYVITLTKEAEPRRGVSSLGSLFAFRLTAFCFYRAAQAICRRRRQPRLLRTTNSRILPSPLTNQHLSPIIKLY